MRTLLQVSRRNADLDAFDVFIIEDLKDVKGLENSALLQRFGNNYTLLEVLDLIGSVQPYYVQTADKQLITQCLAFNYRPFILPTVLYRKLG